MDTGNTPMRCPGVGNFSEQDWGDSVSAHSAGHRCPLPAL